MLLQLLLLLSIEDNKSLTLKTAMFRYSSSQCFLPVFFCDCKLPFDAAGIFCKNQLKACSKDVSLFKTNVFLKDVFLNFKTTK